MNKTQEPKYKIEDGKLVNRASGEAIPDDEPVMIFRARDVHAVEAIAAYRRMCGLSDHREAVFERQEQFQNWATEHKARMKEPDTVFPFSG